MKKLILAASLIAVSALAMSTLTAFDASAQRHEEHRGPGGPGPRWEGGHGAPPPGAWRYARSHDWCVEKARRVHDFELRGGRLDRRDLRILDELRADLRASCGGGRWHPNRGWYY